MPEELLDPDKAAEPDENVPRCVEYFTNTQLDKRWKLGLPLEWQCDNELELAQSLTCAPDGHTYCPDHTSEIVQALRCCSEECAIKEAERLQQRTPQEPSRSKGLPVWQK